MPNQHQVKDYPIKLLKQRLWKHKKQVVVYLSKIKNIIPFYFYYSKVQPATKDFRFNQLLISKVCHFD